MMKRTFLYLLALSALLLTGCMQEADDLPGSEVTDLIQEELPAEDPVSEEIASETFSIPYMPGKALDPITCPDGIQQIAASLIFEGLFRLSPTLEPEPWLCRSFRYDAETCTYTLTLRSDITFSDGSPLTAEDAKATLERAKTSPRYANRLAEVTAISAEGAILTITLAGPNTGFTALLDIPIVKAGTEADAPIGTGPYLYSDAGGSAALIGNQLWWRTEVMPLERITLVETADPESLRYRLTSHDIQLATADLIGTDPIPATGNIVYQDVDTTTLQYIGLNVTRESLASPALRRVLGLGLHHSFLTSAFLSGHAAPTQFPVSPVSALYPTALEREYSLTAFSQAVDALETLPRQPLTFLVNAENSFKVSLATRLAADYTQKGIPVEVNALPWEEYTAALAAGNFDLYYGEVRLSADWDLTSLLATGGALNYGGWADPQTDALLAAYAAAEDRAAAMETLCAHLQDRNPILPLCFKRTSVLMQSNVIDHLRSTATEPFYGLADCTIHLNASTSTDGAVPNEA